MAIELRKNNDFYERKFGRLKALYIEHGYEVVEDYELHLQVSKVIDDEEYRVLIIGPHEGNDFKWGMRADPMSQHDRWINCAWETWFNDFDSLARNALRWFWDESLMDLVHNLEE